MWTGCGMLPGHLTWASHGPQLQALGRMDRCSYVLPLCVCTRMCALGLRLTLPVLNTRRFLHGASALQGLVEGGRSGWYMTSRWAIQGAQSTTQQAWLYSQGKVVFCLFSWQVPVWRVSWSTTGSILAVSDANNQVTLWKESVDGLWQQVHL